MKTFMGKNFLLTTKIAKELYHQYAKKMPVLDYHCHINPQEIAEDRHFENITQIWLGGDHYKWRQMRSNGVAEDYITGEASDFEKFEKWAETLEKLIGNPLYHWSHLELKRYFGFDKPLSKKTAKEAWDFCNEKLKKPEMGVRNIIKQSKVTLICTTDDPIDSLKWHEAIKEDESFAVQVLPAWRPDKAMNIEKEDFLNYVEELSEITQIKVDSFKALKSALTKRMEFFKEHGCKASDHALDSIRYLPAAEAEIEGIFMKRLAGKEITTEEGLKYRTAFMLYAGKEYQRLGWIMQLHFSCGRNNNTRAFQQLGPDTGFDCVNNNFSATEMTNFLDAFNKTKELPKTILYSLNPNDNTMIGTIIGCFQEGGTPGKLQQGSAWWFNDHKAGMTEQMISLANLGILANFIGMLTDSRSFLSYTRHEYFRRILCELIGGWVENGEYPNDQEALEKIIKDISYNNAVNYFEFELQQQ